MSDFTEHFAACSKNAKPEDNMPSFSKTSPFVLCTTGLAGSYHHYYYDFLNCVMTLRNSASSSPAENTIPFSQMAPETLEFMHAKLVEMNGTPPPLPEAYTVAAQRKPAALNKPEMK